MNKDISIVFKQIDFVKVVPASDLRTELTDLLIEGVNSEGESVSIRIPNYNSTSNMYMEFARYYNRD